jgi:hypothetical protein
MAAVPVVLELPAPLEDTADPQEITVVDMDEFSTAHKCNCSAGDDNPY